MRYVYASFACLLLFVIYALVAFALGWQHGGGAIPLLMVVIAIAAIWRALTKQHVAPTVMSPTKSQVSSSSTTTPEVVRPVSVRAQKIAEADPRVALLLSHEVEAFWANALQEYEGPARRPGLFARVYAEGNGDETAAKVSYLRLRVAELEADHRAAVAERQREISRVARETALSHLTEAERKYEMLPKGMCPNCDAVIPISSQKCPTCRAMLGLPDGWRVVPLADS